MGRVFAVLLPAIAAGVFTWVFPGNFGGPALPPGLVIIAGGAVIGAVLSLPTRQSVTRELLAMAAAASATALVMGWRGVPWNTARAAGAIILGAWLVPYALAFPVRAAGAPALARVVLLLVLGLSLSTPYLVPSALTDLPPGPRSGIYDPTPSWVIAWNPLARLHICLFTEDWFHSPPLYPRIGERPFHAGSWDEGVGAPAAAAGIGAAVSALVLLCRARLLRRSVTA